MSSFTKPLIAEFVGKNRWKTVEEFEYHVGTYPSNEVIKVPVGFTTDFASIPRIFWPLISPIDNHAKAGILHDYMYNGRRYSRKYSDDVFKEALEVLNVSPIKIFLMYWAVRLFGWIGF